MSNEDINSSAIKIAVLERSAYDLWLTENFKKAELIKVNTMDDSHKLFREGGADVLAGLKPKLIEELKINSDFKIISNPFTYIKQSIGIKKGNPEILEFFTYSERLVTNVGGVLNLLILVVVFRPARRVYRFLANSVSEETRRPASTIGTGLSMLVVIIGTIAYYALPEMKY